MLGLLNAANGMFDAEHRNHAAIHAGLSSGALGSEGTLYCA